MRGERGRGMNLRHAGLPVSETNFVHIKQQHFLNYPSDRVIEYFYILFEQDNKE